MHKRIAIDAMGGEGGPELTVPAALGVLEGEPSLALTLVGDQSRIEPLLKLSEVGKDRCRVLHAESAISDVDSPSSVLRRARRSSMYLAAELVRDGEVAAMVSAGNTGALLMIGRHLLKTIPGIQKPAIVATIPGATQQSYLLDVGANPECAARQLFQFAVMGSVLAESLSGEPARVGLLNIGAEHFKGTDEVRQASALLEECKHLNYIGFIEANALFESVADVVVCDGFVGNVTIKSSAGVANVIQNMLLEELQQSLLARLSERSSSSMISRLIARINPQRFNGATLLGLQGSVVKSHGNATEEGFAYAIRQAMREVENAVPQLIGEKVAAIMSAN